MEIKASSPDLTESDSRKSEGPVQKPSDPLDELLTECMKEAAEALPRLHKNYENYHGKVKRVRLTDSGICVIERIGINDAHRRLQATELSDIRAGLSDREIAKSALKDIVSRWLQEAYSIQELTFKPCPEDPDCSISINKFLSLVGQTPQDKFVVTDAFRDPDGHPYRMYMYLQPIPIDWKKVSVRVSNTIADFVKTDASRVKVQLYERDRGGISMSLHFSAPKPEDTDQRSTHDLHLILASLARDPNSEIYKWKDPVLGNISKYLSPFQSFDSFIDLSPVRPLT